MELPRAPDGGADYDQILGSILERWLTTTIPGKCRFCRESLEGEGYPPGFCNFKCRAAWLKVQDARIEIGKRDLKQRGYD